MMWDFLEAKEVTGCIDVVSVVTTIAVVGMLVLSPRPRFGRADRSVGVRECSSVSDTQV